MLSIINDFCPPQIHSTCLPFISVDRNRKSIEEGLCWQLGRGIVYIVEAKEIKSCYDRKGKPPEIYPSFLLHNILPVHYTIKQQAGTKRVWQVDFLLP